MGAESVFFYQWSVLLKNKKVGHVLKFISCTGLDNTGRSLFSDCTGQRYHGSLNRRSKGSFQSSYEPYLVH